MEDTELCVEQSMVSSVVSAQLASKFGAHGCLLLLPGAVAAKGATPSMLAYGMAKAAVHQLTASLSHKEAGLPPDSTVLCMLPVTLDTPMNRSAMPDADRSTWTPLTAVADRVLEWSSNTNLPPTGSLVSFITKDGKTTLVWR